MSRPLNLNFDRNRLTEAVSVNINLKSGVIKMTGGTDALSAGDIEMIVPAGGCDAEQMLAYKNFIAVLSAILVKYATELDSEESA